MFRSLFVLFVASVNAFSPQRRIQSAKSTTKVSIVLNDKTLTVKPKEEKPSMMSSPAFKVLDFLMSVPLIHG